MEQEYLLGEEINQRVVNDAENNYLKQAMSLPNWEDRDEEKNIENKNEASSIAVSTANLSTKKKIVGSTTTATIWSILEEKYPDYVNTRLDIVRGKIVKKHNYSHSYYPQIGIQRSVSDMNFKTRFLLYFFYCFFSFVLLN
jgi:hypothetical protein